MVKEKYSISKLRFETRIDAMEVLNRMSMYGDICKYDYYSLVGFLGLADDEMRKYLDEKPYSARQEIAYTEEELDKFYIVKRRDGYSIIRNEEA